VAQIFVSHSSADNELAAKVKASLADLGYESVFLDFDPTGGLVPGQAWRYQLFTYLDACDAFVFITTPKSNASQWCHSELALTRWLRKPILALLVDGCAPHPLTADLQGLHVTSDAIDPDQVRSALTALGLAHTLGLVHRDIKPENLLLERSGRLRITDFGLALALRGQGKFGGATSQSGTPQFAAPEQLLGERVDQRADLYSLAAVACFALLGEAPFPGTTPEQVLAKQTAERFPDIRARRPDVRHQLVEVLERALRNEPDERFPSAAEFMQALNKVAGIRHRSGEWTKQALTWWRSKS